MRVPTAPTTTTDITEPASPALANASLTFIPQFTSLQACPSEDTSVCGLIRISTPPLDASQGSRVPLHVCVLLDISGSMAGAGMKYAKSAVRKIIKRLSIDDVLHLVVYESNARLIFEKGDLDDKQRLIAQVNNLRATGCTNLSAGLELAHQILNKNCPAPLPGQPKPIKRIFLFSDGHINEGVTETDELCKIIRTGLLEFGITLSSFGMGADFNEELMKNAAKQGQGDYFFINNNDVVPSYVSKAIQGLISVFGTNALLKVQSVHPGVSIVSVGSTNVDGHSDALTHELGDLHNNNTKNLLVQLRVTKDTLAKTGDLPLCTLELRFDRTSSITKTSSNRILSGRASVLVGNEQGTENNEVFVSLRMQQISREEKVLLSMVDKGMHKEAAEKKKELISIVEQQVKPRDSSGRIDAMVRKMQEAVAQLSINTEAAKKQMDYCAYAAEEDDEHLCASPQYSACSVEAFDSGDIANHSDLDDLSPTSQDNSPAGFPIIQYPNSPRYSPTSPTYSPSSPRYDDSGSDTEE